MVKVSLAIFTLALCSAIGLFPSWAQQSQLSGADVEANCVKNGYTSSLYGCACLGKAYDAGQGRMGTLTPAMLSQCPAAKSAISTVVERSCTDYYKHVRSDFAELCSCAAEKVAASWHDRPGVSLRQFETLRRDSLKSCGMADQSHNLK